MKLKLTTGDSTAPDVFEQEYEGLYGDTSDGRTLIVRSECLEGKIEIAFDLQEALMLNTITSVIMESGTG